MSRIGKQPVAVPANVEVTIDGHNLTVKGPKGELHRSFNPMMTIAREGDEIIVSRPDDSREAKSLHGLTRTLIHNMVEGVEKGFQKKLQLVGVGYRAALKGTSLELSLGYSHPVIIEAPEGISFEVPSQTEIDRSRREQRAGWPDCCRHSQVAQAGALQGQGHSLRRRGCASQAWQGC